MYTDKTLITSQVPWMVQRLHNHR